MVTTTPNFNYNKPNVADPVDADLWGGQLNSNVDSLDADLPRTISDETVNFTVLNTEFNFQFQVDTSAGTVTASLPAGTTVFNGFVLNFKIEDATNSLILDGDAAETIDGNATFTVIDFASIIWDGTEWNVVQNGAAPPPPIDDATLTVKGIVELGTEAQIEAETAVGETGASLVATPATMKFHPGVPKAWMHADGTGTPSVVDSYNFSSSITDNGTGNYTFTFSTAMANANYAVICSSQKIAGNYLQVTTEAQATTTVQVINVDFNADPTDGTEVMFAILGDI